MFGTSGHDRIRFTRQSNRIINVAIEIPCLFIGTYESTTKLESREATGPLNDDGEDVLFNLKRSRMYPYAGHAESTHFIGLRRCKSHRSDSVDGILDRVISQKKHPSILYIPRSDSLLEEIFLFRELA